MPRLRALIYDQTYIKKCFDSWYLNGRPASPTGIKRILPPHESGRVATTATIRRWMVDGAWDAWADELDAKAMILADDSLVDKKVQMLRRHQEDAMVLATKAKEYILSDGFDSSAAAVSAYFKATEEQRKTAGFSDLLEKLQKMTNNDVEQEIIKLLNRAADNDQVVDAESEDVEVPEE